MPLMLLAASHVRRDIPAAVCNAVANHSGIDVRMARHLGCASGIVALSQLRRRQAIDISTNELFSHDQRAEPKVVLVSRGSRDPNASEEMYRFAELATADLATKPLVGFYAMTQPSLPETLRLAIECPQEQIVVQPHLLFQGELLHEIRQQVEAYASECKRRKRWFLAPHLGPHEILAATIAEHYREAWHNFSIAQSPE